MLARELAQSALESVPLHDGLAELRDEERDTRITDRGAHTTYVDQARFDSLTRAEQLLDVSGAR